VKHGKHREVASSSRAPSGFLPLRRVNSSPGIAERRGNVCHTNMEVNFQYPRSTKKGELHVINRSMDTSILTLLFCA
jgi:hypothetical protein